MDNIYPSLVGLFVLLKLLFISTVVISAAGCSRIVADTGVKTASKEDNDMQIARDGNIAIQEEFDASIAKNTIAAYELFIARHPDHKLTKQAKTKLTELKSKPMEY